MPSIKNYFSLIKFSHTIFAMPFALIGFFLGVRNKSVDSSFDGKFNDSLIPLIDTVINFVLVLICMITARSAAMAFNRYLDNQFDAKNPRTAIREIPAGIISEKNALFFTILMCVLFVVCT